MRSVFLFVFTALLGFGFIQPLAYSASVAELQAGGHLEISSELIPAHSTVPGQRVELAITIATDTWFTGGTRLEIPEIPGLVILQTNDFASNSSENRKGQSWVVQRWTLDVFPQRQGSFTIDSISAKVKVSDGGANSVEGELHSPELHFQTAIPQSLERAEHWVAAPRFTVSQSFDRELDNLQPGEAFQREIAFEATDIMAMMLPTFETENLQGLAVYPEPSSLSNSSNRGEMIARRVERISYVVETAGQYQLPARDYFWWDTRTGELQMRFLPAVEITIGGGAGGEATVRSPLMDNIDTRQLLIYAILAVLSFGVGWQLYKGAKRIPLARYTASVKDVLRRLNQMRKPALPRSLNPDGNAGE